MIGEWISDVTMFTIWFLVGLISLAIRIGGASAMMLIVSTSAFLTAFAMKSYSLHLTLQVIFFLLCCHLGFKARAFIRERKRVMKTTLTIIPRPVVIEQDKFITASHKKAT